MNKLHIVKVTRKYQITIPKKIREKLNIKVGDKLVIKNRGRKNHNRAGHTGGRRPTKAYAQPR